MEDAHRGETALNAGKLDEAVSYYTEALKQSPTAPPYYIKRSTAYQRLRKYQESLDDAEMGVIHATKRAKRELIAQAQLRRGIALFHLERYGDAELCFALSKKYDKNEKMVGIWEAKVKPKLKDLADDDPKKAVSIKEVPEEKKSEAANPADGTSTASNVKTATNGDANAQQITPSPQTTQTPADKIRHEWYQNNDNVYLTLLAKGVPKDKASIDIQPNSLSISFPLSSGSSYDFSLEPLFAPVDAANSSFRILGTKIELILKKSTPGQKWHSLESTGTEQSTTINTTSTTQPVEKGPSYPTSSRSGPKNWDKIANSYVKPKDNPESDGTNKTVKDGDDMYINDLDEGGDELNSFFKQLYAGADADTRRAMMKSYQESGGTALSTNWGEVKDKKYDVQPPDGMEAREWET